MGALVLAALLGVMHFQRSRSEPERTALELIRAAGHSDLTALAAASTPGWYARFVRHFGEERYARVSAIYQRARDLGRDGWLEYRRRMDSQAAQAYEELQERVVALGREAFAALPVEQRLPFTESRGLYDAFVFEAGIKALPQVDQAAIPDAEAFRSRRSRDGFVQANGWRFLSAEDRAVAGDPSALASSDTPAKGALLERLGLPRLEKGLQAEISGMKRSELDDPESFKLKYGAAIAQEYLRSSQIPTPGSPAQCEFDALATGGLLRGQAASCEVALPIQGRTVALHIHLTKVDFDWLVDRMIDRELYQVDWRGSR